MIKSTAAYKLSDIFNSEQQVVYEVPRYQREYTWSKNQWEKMFDDLIDNDSGYFLGSILCINSSKDALGIPRLEVVDGQQRLITISILFLALYTMLRNDKSRVDDQSYNIVNLGKRLVFKGKKYEMRVVPQIQNENFNDYRFLLFQEGLYSDKVYDAPKWAANRKLFRAFKYFKSRIADKVSRKSNKSDAVFSLTTKLYDAILIKMEVENHANAYTLFESLNDRGTPLTPIDLIKNKLLAEIDKSKTWKLDDGFRAWQYILENLEDDYVIQERFFRQYYNAFKETLNAPFQDKDQKRRDPLGSEAMRSNLISIYEKLIKKDADKCLENLQNASKVYSQLLKPDFVETPSPLTKPLKDLDRIQGSPSYLLMLYLLMKREYLELNYSMLCRIVELLVAFFVRRNLTNTPATYGLTRLFTKIVTLVSRLKSDDIVRQINIELQSVSASDQVFEDHLQGSLYSDNKDLARFVVCSIAEEGMNNEKFTDLWTRVSGRYVWTIEHIFPQGDKIPDSWVEMVADGDKDMAEELRQSHVHKLGNLTLTGFNSSLGNRSFSDKRDRTDNNGKFVGYKNGFSINEELENLKQWNIEAIDERTKRLSKELVKKFSLE